MGRVPGGRRPILTNPEIYEAIIRALEIGGTLRDAAESNGVAERALMQWLSRGRADEDEEVDSIYVQFLHDATRAQSAARMTAVAVVRRAMAEDWKAALEFLKRRDRYAWSDRLELAGDPQAPVLKLELSAKELRELASELLED